MPGLLRGMAKTAAVVGTATATRNVVNRRQADKNVAAYTSAVDKAYAPPPQQYAPPPQQYAPPPQQEYYPPPAAAEEDMITQLERLGAMRAQGLLSDEEFATAKQRLLAG
ncbi:MAG: SHOCT domain-containing protein [Chloroflexales bacterium]|nr:SHOCT domain-containing protein [Chloroflexales bacterium]